MNNEKTYLPEFEFYDGEDFVTFNIIEIQENNTIDVAVSNRGKISVQNYDLRLEQKTKEPYFEYGVMLDKIYLSNFI